MTTTSDIVLKLLKDKGYKYQRQFCNDFGIDEIAFSKAVANNSWHKSLIEKVGKALGENLSSFANK